MKYLTGLFLLCISFAVFAWEVSPQPASLLQGITVTGTVTDQNGETLPGAAVHLKGTLQGVITDIDGRYSIAVPDGEAVIVFSFVGFTTQEVVVGDRTAIHVQLTEQSNELEEVIIVGYAAQRVKDLTGSAVSVKMEELATLPGASIVQSLAGQVIGLSVSQNREGARPGNTATFTIRQPLNTPGSTVSGLTTNNQPLIVIDDMIQVDRDGLPEMTAFNMLDPSEIESLVVLKDASAAVYGARASNGVILVKTKKGQEGTPKINYSLLLDYADAISHPKTMSAYEQGVYINRSYMRTFETNGEDYRNKLFSDYELERMKRLNYDWLDKAWQPALSQRHSLNVSGGTLKVTYFAGLNYQTQKTNLGKVQDYDRWTFRTGGTIQVVAGLTLSASLSGYTNSQVTLNDQIIRDDYSVLHGMPKYVPWDIEFTDEKTGEIKRYWVAPWGEPNTIDLQTDEKRGNSRSRTTNNFFAIEDSDNRIVKNNNGFTANFSLNYDVPFIKGLSIKGGYSATYSNGLNNEIGDYLLNLAHATDTDQPGQHLIGNTTVWDFINWGDPNGPHHTVATNPELDRKPRIRYTKTRTQNMQANLSISYSRTFGQHFVSATAVVERAENEGTEEAIMYRGREIIFNGASVTAGKLSTNAAEIYFKKFESGALSYVGRANYKYSDRYLLDFIVRADASTKFAPENYWGIFPTVGLGWVVSEEGFFKNSRLSNHLNFLKFRYSIGQTGKDNTDAWYWMMRYDILETGSLGFGTAGGVPQLGLKPSNHGAVNRLITWDSSTKQNVGLDMSTLQSRMSVGVEFYYDKTVDLPMLDSSVYPEDAPLPLYIGKRPVFINYGKRDAWGWEFSVRWKDRVKQSLIPSWGDIHYGIGMDYGISWNKTVRGIGEQPKDYPAYNNQKNEYNGYHSPDYEWGFRTWKHTSGGDGILRNQQDIDNYWQYLTDLAVAYQATLGGDGQPQYLRHSSKDKLFPGMLAYECIRGDYADTPEGYQAMPNGKVPRASDSHSKDFVKLAKRRTYGINTRMNLRWGDFNFSTMINTSWGGFSDWQMDTPDLSNAGYPIFLNAFHPTDNPNGKYPGVGIYEGNSWNGDPSDFWQISTFRMYIRNIVMSYSLPKEWMKKSGIGIDNLALNLTINNVAHLFNPYPEKFTTPWNGLNPRYPTLRTWSFGLNVTL